MKKSKHSEIVKKIGLILINEEGGVTIVATLLIMAILTLLVMSLSKNSTTETMISGNSVKNKLTFYAAESAWQDASFWLESRGTPPNFLNESTDNVKYFGDNNGTGNDPRSNSGITPDRTLSGIPCWYNVENVEVNPVPGSGPGFRDITYKITSVAKVPSSLASADVYKTINVNVSKVFKVGY